jgi:hypothetical protein
MRAAADAIAGAAAADERSRLAKKESIAESLLTACLVKLICINPRRNNHDHQ